MTNEKPPFITKYFTNKAISLYIILLVFISIFFIDRVLPFIWIIFGLVEVITFFYFSNLLTKRWSLISNQIYKKKLFQIALVIRIVYVVFSYFFYNFMTGQPFEFDTGDALGYFEEAKWAISLFKSNEFYKYVNYINVNERYSDLGFPSYLIIIQYVFGDVILLVRLLNALMSAFTCLLIYKLAVKHFGESTGRIAGILSMLLPNFIFYCGLHLKETIMIFFVVSFAYQADKLLRFKRLKIKEMLMVSLICGSLFFFRTVLAACLILSFITSILLISNRISGPTKKIAMVFLGFFVVVMFLSTSVSKTIDTYIDESVDNLESQMLNFTNRKNGNTLAIYGTTSIFLPMMLSAPFPTFLDTGQKNIMMNNGTFFTRNIYSYFVFVALFLMIKRKVWREHILLLSITASYLLVLSLSGFALSERFHLPAVPFLLILASYGISQMEHKHKKFYVPYLVLIMLVIIGWNWFKFTGRGY